MPDDYHPWNEAGTMYGDWIIRRTSLGGLLEVMCWKRRVILLERDRTRAELRSDLAHALAHIDLRHRRLDDKAEVAATRYAAKRLIARERVAAALAETGGEVTVETAEILDVDMETLFARLSYLHPAEKAYIREHLASVLEARTA